MHPPIHPEYASRCSPKLATIGLDVLDAAQQFPKALVATLHSHAASEIRTVEYSESII